MANNLPPSWVGSVAPGIGAAFGTGIAKSLQSGLDLLAQSKMDEINNEKNRREDERVAQLFVQGGHEEPTARILAELLRKEPKSIIDVLKTLGSGGPIGEQQGQGGGEIGLPDIGMQAGPEQLPEQQPNLNQNPNQSLLDLFRQAGMQGGGMGLQGALGAPQGAQGLAALQTPVQPMQQQAPAPEPARKPLAAPKKPSFAQSFAQGTAREKNQSEAEKKHEASVISAFHNLMDMKTTTARMLESLKSPEFDYGVIPSLKSATFPTWLNETTEQFDKDANHVINLSSADLKGVPSVFRVKLLKKEKAGVEHSPAVNKQILTRLNKDSDIKLNTLRKKYPNVIREAEQAYMESSDGGEGAQMAVSSPDEDASLYQDGTLVEHEGRNFVARGNKWIPQGV